MPNDPVGEADMLSANAGHPRTVELIAYKEPIAKRNNPAAIAKSKLFPELKIKSKCNL